MIDQSSFKKFSILVVLATLLILSALLLWPIATAIITGLILAYLCYPLYKKVFSLVKEKNISALIIVLLFILIIFVPLWFLFPIIIKQIFDLYLYIQKIDVSIFLKLIFPNLVSTEIFQNLTTSLNHFISTIISKILSSASNVFLNLPNFLLKLSIVLFVFFFGMRDADLFENYIKSLSPFSKATENELAKKFRDITSSVIKGHILIGILQGILTGIGLFIVGMPNALLLTGVSIFAAIIPILGAWLVWIPASVYLILSGKTFLGIVLFLYGAIFISWIDNIIRPYIVAKKAKISSVIVLIGMIGGLIVFGVLGLIIGPLILAYLLLILDAYRKNKIPGLFS